MSLGKLVIAITGTTKGLEKAVSKSRKLLGGLTSIGSGMALPAVLGGVGAGAAAAGLARIGDSWAVMGKQLEFVTGNAEDAQRVQDRLYQISKKTGTQISDNANTFVKLEQASKLTGNTMDDNLNTIETLNTLMQLTGTSGLQASAAMLQLSQGLTSGKLAGDEFRSLAENAPGLLQKLSEAMDIPIENLKEMSSEGELTSERLGQAFRDLNEQGTQSFGELPNTVWRGLNSVALAFGNLWDYINDETGIISEIENALLDVAQYIEDNSESIKEWVKDGWEKFIKSAPDTIETLRTIGESIIWVVEKIADGIKLIKTFYEIAQTGLSASKAYLDLNQQKAFSDQQLNDDSATYYDYTSGEYTPEGSQRGGTTVVNHFNQNVSRSDVVNITAETAIQAARL